MTRHRPRQDKSSATDEDGLVRSDPGSVLVSVLLVAIAIATLVGIVGATTVVIGFEGFDDGTELVTQFEDAGILIPPQPDQTAGAVVVRCSPDDNNCPEAESGQNAIMTPRRGDVVREPLEVRFDEPQDEVRLYVREAAGNEGRQFARVEARDASRTLVAERTIGFEVDSGWHRVGVTTDSPRIRVVTLTLTDERALEAGVEPHNRLVADELVAERPDEPPPAVDPWVAGGIVIVVLVVLWLAWKGVSRVRGDGDGEDGNLPPRPGLATTPEEPVAGRPVAFDGTSSYDPDPEDAVSGYEWTIEGQPSAGPRVVHRFDEAGEYDVSLTVTDRHGVSETATTTVTVEEGEGELDLTRAHPDAPGDDHENLHREFLVFENVGEGTLDLSGWTVHDAAEAEDRVTEGEHTFEFPDGFELEPDATVAVHTGPEPDDAADSTETDADRHCYWGREWAVWNNEADVIVVENAEGDPVLGIRYERTDDGEYELEDLEPASLGDWISAVEVDPADGPSVEPPDVPTDAESGVTARLRDLAAGLVFQRGPGGLLVSWTLVALVSFLTQFDTVFGVSAVVLGVGVAWAVVQRIRS